jgi:hypothetical protein
LVRPTHDGWATFSDAHPWGSTIKRSTAAGILVALFAGLAVGTGAGDATAQSGPIVHHFTTATDTDTGSDPALSRASASPTKDCSPPAPNPIPNDQPIVVSLPPAALFTVGRINPYVWKHPMVSSPAWRLSFEAFLYLPPLAVRAAQDGQLTSLSTIVKQVVAFHTQNPDVGSSAYGWDEGTAQRRLMVENCLYELTHAKTLVPGMVADASVQLGSRYYGPPYHPVHNHGLMANLRLIVTGELLGHSTWVSTALNRMAHEAPLAFSAQGTSWEQSSTYQQVNYSLWQTAADELAQRSAYAATARAIRVTTAKAHRVIGWMTEPDGHLVQIGDSDRTDGVPTATLAGTFRDNAAGYIIGRWSRTDRTTSYYTLRYGPARRAHGQEDRGGITWSTLGKRVLVGPGRFDYDARSGFDVWRTSPISHNVAIPMYGAFAPKAPASVTGSTIQSGAHAYSLVDYLYGRAHSRTVNFFNATHRMVVRDAYAGGAAFHQHWHLDPTWQFVSVAANSRSLIFQARSGQQLLISTTGRVSGVTRGATRPVAGWTFPLYGVRTPSYQIAIRSYNASVVTTFMVIDAVPVGHSLW